MRFPSPRLLAVTPSPRPTVVTPSSQLTTIAPSPLPTTVTPSPHLPHVDTPLFDVVSRSDSESEGSDIDGMHEPDVDERSDDEDDRAAHEFLQAAPTTAEELNDPQAVLPYNHQGFAVSRNTCPLTPASTYYTFSDIGTW